MSFEEVIYSLISDTQGSVAQGKKFEKCIKNILQKEPSLQKMFHIKAVYLWQEFSDMFHINRHDFGIDIVILNQQDELIAVQCKAFAPEHKLALGDLKNFLAINTIKDSQGKVFKISQSLIFHTCKKISFEIEKALEQNANESKLKALAFGYNELKALDIEWRSFEGNAIDTSIKVKEKKKLRPHQSEAFAAIKTHFLEQNNARGKVIMACGTGKSLLAIRTIDECIKEGEIALFLTPSLALTNQMIKEFFAQSVSEHYEVFAVCSDSRVGSKSARDEKEDIGSGELCIPPSTNASHLAHTLLHFLHQDTHKDKAYTQTFYAPPPITSLKLESKHTNPPNSPNPPKIIIFSTYQSIDVIIEAQKIFAKEIKLIINDEAHRTAGVQKLDEQGEEKAISVWQKTHDNTLLQAKYRLYLTATPRIFAAKAKEKLKKESKGKDLMLFSMDDESLFGKEIYTLNFGKAIQKELLSDFRVVISFCREEVIAEYLGKLTKAQENSKLTITNAGKMISFANALKKINMSFVDENGIQEAFIGDKEPMKRAVAFHSSIRNSKFTTEQFDKISKDILLEHIDGTHNAYEKAQKIAWLSGIDETSPEQTRVLSNAKCLTEGIDVPNLDAVCFFDKRDSIVDIVQAVGRAIRKSEGKKYGYIILPLVLTDEEIKNYDKTLKEDKFKIVWDTLKALRSHDERLIDSARIAQVVSFLTDSSEIVDLPQATLFTLDMLFNEIKNAVPKNLGDLQYWEHYASKVGQIMGHLSARIKSLSQSNANIAALFATFCQSLKSNLNASFDTDEAIALIAQHIITKPIFECIFPHLNFATFDKVSAELEKLHQKLLEQGLSAETAQLERFYESVRNNAQYAQSDKSKQELIKNLYDTLFKEAFKKAQEKLGIVYTPIEGVDFVIHSIAYALKKHFNKNLSDDNIHICDPFTGTGTFITRLIQSGYLDSNLENKYKKELWANEITLLGYYIAQINIATTYHERLLKLQNPHNLAKDSQSNGDYSRPNLQTQDVDSYNNFLSQKGVYPPSVPLNPEKDTAFSANKGETSLNRTLASNRGEGTTASPKSDFTHHERGENLTQDAQDSSPFTLLDNLLFTDTFLIPIHQS